VRPTCHDIDVSQKLAEESSEVDESRRMEAPAARIFEILANPHRTWISTDRIYFGAPFSTVPSPAWATPSP
jgi:hypothetical protein